MAGFLKKSAEAYRRYTPFSQKHPSHHLKDKIGHIPKNGQKHNMPWTCFQGRIGVKNTLKIYSKHPDELLEPR
jgi:hypothetical protein